MPIVMSTNNKILPNNSRVVDVSRRTIDRILPTQIRKYHNAFIVQGNQCIIYNKLNNGVKCGCKAKVSSVKTRLGQDGKASPELINELLTGGHEFGILAYGSEIADAPNSREKPSNSWVITDQTQNKKVELYNRTDAPDSGPMVGAHHDVWNDDPNNPNTGTITYSGFGPNGPAAMDDDLETLIFDDDKFDNLSLGLRDCACPVCFGSGYVGGFQVFNGWRKVINFQWEEIELFDSNINYDIDVPSITGNAAEFKIQFPRGASHVDSLKVWNFNRVVPASFSVDGNLLTSDSDLLRFFDGQIHTVRVELTHNYDEVLTWTHIEIQVHQSEDVAYLDFPKMTKSSIQSKIESFSDVQLVVSPLVPVIRTLDIVADSTYNKIFQVKDCTWWNDKKLTTLGWDCNARPVQPAELYSMLPRCSPVRSFNRPAMVTTNVSNAV